MENLAKQSVYYILISLAAAFVWFLIGLNAWQTYHTNIAFQSFIAFSAIACVAVALLAYKDRPIPLLALIQSALFFASALHGGFAVDDLLKYNPLDPAPLVYTRSTLNLFNDLMELFLLSLLFLLSIMLSTRCKNQSRNRLYAFAFGSAISLMLVYTALSGRIIQVIPESIMPSLGMVLSAGVIILLGATCYFAYQSASDSFPLQPIAFIVFCILLASSSVPLLIPIFLPSYIWTFAVTLQSTAFFVLYMSICIPYLQIAGMKSKEAAIFSSGISILFLAPLLVTLAMERVAPGFKYVDPGAYLIIHLGAASVSAVMALMTYGHAKTMDKRNLYPLILLFTSWTVVDLVQVVMAQLPLPYIGESLVPYVTGSLVSLLAFYLVIRWTSKPPPTNLPAPKVWPILGILIQFGLVAISLLIESTLTVTIPGLLDSPVGRGALLIINLFAMFEFTYLIVYLSRRSGGGLTVEVLLTGFLSLWIVSGILKANFTDWTAGWYSAELLLLVALLFGPGVLGLLYIQELRRAESAHQRSAVYSDLLVHDISNYHQAILISLGLLDVDGLQQGVREQAIKDAQSELKRADELIRNVRQIGMSETVSLQNLERIDLVQSIQNSYENAVPLIHQQSIEFAINRNVGECYVLANALIEGIFTNLLRNAIKYSPNKKRIDIEIGFFETQNASFWTTRVIDFGQGIEPSSRVNLFNRFMTGAKGTGLGLSVAKTLTEVFGGSISVEDRVEGDYSKGSVFIVSLPAAL
jgi:signal transduction histidine kinase/branched-subunit amino acid transport protein AzlD